MPDEVNALQMEIDAFNREYERYEFLEEQRKRMEEQRKRVEELRAGSNEKQDYSSLLPTPALPSALCCLLRNFTLSWC